MKKFVSLAMTAVLMLSSGAAVLSACGAEGDDAEHTIYFYSSQGNTLVPKTQIAIDIFEAKYPGWKVEHTQPGGYDEVRTKVNQDLLGEIQPDVAYCYADHVAGYLPTEQVIDMSKFINSTEKVAGKDPATGADVEYTVGYSAAEIADFVPGYYAEGKATNYSDYDQYGFTADSILTLPFVKSTELLYYNDDAVKKLGLTIPTTWDELWDQAKKVKDNYSTATLLGYDSEANWFITMCEQNGWGYTSASGNHYLFNDSDKNADLKSWLTTLNNYWNSGLLTTQMDYGAYTSGLFTMGIENDAGGCVYCIGSSGGASHQKSSKFTAKVAPIPGSKQSDGSVNYSAISQGPSLVMFNAGNDVTNADEKAKMTFLFIKELLDPDFQAEFSQAAGYNPSRESVYELESYITFMEGNDLVAQAAALAKDLSDRFFTSPAFIGSSDARTQVGNVVKYVMRGEKSATDALQDAYKNCGGR